MFKLTTVETLTLKSFSTSHILHGGAGWRSSRVHLIMKNQKKQGPSPNVIQSSGVGSLFTAAGLRPVCALSENEKNKEVKATSAVLVILFYANSGLR